MPVHEAKIATSGFESSAKDILKAIKIFSQHIAKKEVMSLEESKGMNHGSMARELPSINIGMPYVQESFWE